MCLTCQRLMTSNKTVAIQPNSKLISESQPWRFLERFCHNRRQVKTRNESLTRVNIFLNISMKFGQMYIEISQVGKSLLTADIFDDITTLDRFTKIDKFFILERRIAWERFKLCIMLGNICQWATHIAKWGLFKVDNLLNSKIFRD